MVKPKLSLVVAGSRPDGPPPELLDVLRPQLDAGLIEVVIATSCQQQWSIPGVSVCRLPEGAIIPRLRSAGLRAANAQWVAVTEDFCVPGERWARAVLRACETVDALAVGGPIDRKEGGPSAWALTLAEYGCFLARGRPGPVADLPEINVVFNRGRLLDFLNELPEELMITTLLRRLESLENPLWWEPSALMIDVNEMPFGQAIRAQYHHGRLFGGERVVGTGRVNRSLRFLLSPFVPALLLARLVPPCWRAGRGRRLLVALTPLLLLLTAWAAGEAVGAVAGPGDSKRRWR